MPMSSCPAGGRGPRRGNRRCPQRRVALACCPWGADDNGEDGVLDVRLQLLPLEGNDDGEEGVLDVHAVVLPRGGEC